ncbi:MAG: hypothetical protein ACKV2T_31230 [Kofleriaceae bacterium]
MFAAPSKRLVIGSLFLAGLSVSLVGVSIGSAALALRTQAPDPCRIAMDPSSLDAHDRGLVARRLLACSDLTHGRITASEYRAQIDLIDAAWTVEPPAPIAPIVPVIVALPPAPQQWASSVRAMSTQYTADSWAANKVLGAPDVYPAHGDNSNAWASLDADDRDEYLEVGFAQPRRASAVEIYETYNPGAVRSITMITTSGKRIEAYRANPSATGQNLNILRADVGCTAEPIAAVRVELGSKAVEGWNEIDAIGLVPCAEQIAR